MCEVYLVVGQITSALRIFAYVNFLPFSGDFK